MELLIPGLILVALMAYASTRLKKATAQALEPEEIETGEFRISKPAGFINVVSPDDGLLFKAYTKDYADDAPELRKAEATIDALKNTNIEHVLEELKKFGGMVSCKPEIAGDVSPVIAQIDRAERGSLIHRSVKLIQKDDRVYRLQFDTPAGCKEDFAIARREMNESFELLT